MTTNGSLPVWFWTPSYPSLQLWDPGFISLTFKLVLTFPLLWGLLFQPISFIAKPNVSFFTVPYRNHFYSPWIQRLLLQYIFLVFPSDNDFQHNYILPRLTVIITIYSRTFFSTLKINVVILLSKVALLQYFFIEGFDYISQNNLCLYIHTPLVWAYTASDTR